MKDLSTPRRRSGIPFLWNDESHREVTLEIVPGAAVFLFFVFFIETSLPVASQAQERHSTQSRSTWQDCISSFLVPDQKSQGFFFLFFFCLFNTRSRTHLFWKLQRSLWPANSFSKGTWVHPALFSPPSNSYHCYHTVITKRTKTVTHAQTADDWQGVGRQSALRWTCEGQCGDFRLSLTHCHRPDLWCLS